MVVSHLSRKNTAELMDPGDPYLQYSINFPGLFQFNPPAALEPFFERAYIEANRKLMADKMSVLRDLGLKGAFFGREPVYLPEGVYRQHPHWRGPRVDHPRRSRHPVYSPCLHLDEVQQLYRESMAGLVRAHPDLDAFYWWSNDSGSGFCWYPYLYPGANGPEQCRGEGSIAAIAAFQRAVLEEAAAAGAKDPISMMLHTQVWNQDRMPRGAYRHPPAGSEPTVLSIRPTLSSTYPVRFLEDPLYRLEQFGGHAEANPVAVIWWLSDIYHRSHPEPEDVRRLVRLWDLGHRQPAAAKRLPGRLDLLADEAAAEFGPEAADDVVDGWIRLHEAFHAQLNSPFAWPVIMPYLPIYGPVSHRWLTRPMVAFPQELNTDEEDYFLPHVFALGNEARREPLDLHGYPPADPLEDHTLRSRYFDQIAAAFETAGDHFAASTEKARVESAADLHRMVRAAHLMACIWKTIRNWFEYAVLRAQGSEQPKNDPNSSAPASEAARARAAEYRKEMYRILRSEIDNVLRFQELLGDDPDRIIVRATSPKDEDTFTLASDLQSQLTRKRELMLAHWLDVERLHPSL